MPDGAIVIIGGTSGIGLALTRTSRCRASRARRDRPGTTTTARARTPLGRPTTMGEAADAAAFLLENGAVNGANLAVDGGRLLM